MTGSVKIASHEAMPNGSDGDTPLYEEHATLVEKLLLSSLSSEEQARLLHRAVCEPLSYLSHGHSSREGRRRDRR